VPNDELGEWREGRHGFPVLRRLADLALELGDRESAAYREPSPFTDERGAGEPEFEPGEDEPGTEGHAFAGEWWEAPYKGGPMVDVAGFPRALYPAGHSKGQSPPGPDVEAYKRTVCRLGRWDPWQGDGWSDDYIKDFAKGRGTGKVGDSGVRGVQRQQGKPENGIVDEATFNLLRSARVPEAPGFSHGGDMAMDSVAVGLIEQAWQKFHDPPGSVEDVRAAIADFCIRSIRAASKWHYVQHRPMQYGAPPDDDSHDNDDCSEHSTQSYYWARKVTGVAVPDPNHAGYNGSGYTGTQINNPRCSSPYKPGDLALYGASTGSTSHVCTCYDGGDSSSAEWCSNGSENAPYAVELHYRSDLLCVVRPPLMP
jgi:hypothetical protein